MSYYVHNPRDEYHRRPSAPNPVNRSRRSWTNNGTHYTMETSSYSSPGISFGMVSGTANIGLPSTFVSSQQGPRTPGSGLFGAAFDVLGETLLQPQRAAMQNNARRDTRRQVEAEGLAYGETEYREPNYGNRRRSLFARVADKLLSGSQNGPRGTQYGGEPSLRSRRAATFNGRSDSFQTEIREPSWEEGHLSSDEEMMSDEEEDDEEGYRGGYESSGQADMTIEALGAAIQHHHREAKRARKRLEQAIQFRTANSSQLQALLNEVKLHEQGEEKAIRRLREIRNARRRDSTANYRRRQQPPSPMATEDHFEQDFHYTNFDRIFQTHEDPFNSNGFFEMPQTSPLGGFARPSQFPANSPFAFFESLHRGMPGFYFSAGSNPTAGQNGRTRTNPSTTQQPPVFQPPQFTPPRPPATLLKPEEARTLFKAYDQRWNSLSHVDPQIPYPARGLQASALSARDTIWAPLISSAVSSWSEENIMQANAQAFYLGVAGLTPLYTEAGATGKVQMGYDKTTATPVQVKALVDLLKKEKARWHSDRLGRRNGGTGGPNEALQRDQRARAVFHAVCGLMEVAQKPNATT